MSFRLRLSALVVSALVLMAGLAVVGGEVEAQVVVRTRAAEVSRPVNGSREMAGRDEVGEQRGNGETYGAVLSGGNSTFVRVTSDRPVGRVTVLALADGERVITRRRAMGRPATAAVAQPNILAGGLGRRRVAPL